eukprot:6215634-Prymnesium_polylepis.1
MSPYRVRQDQVAVIKNKLCAMMPALSIFLGARECRPRLSTMRRSRCIRLLTCVCLHAMSDVDDLDDVSRLGDHVRASVLLLTFLSRGCTLPEFEPTRTVAVGFTSVDSNDRLRVPVRQISFHIIVCARSILPSKAVLP